MKTYVFGDTGGHLPPLLSSLQKIGVDFTSFTIPENVTIVHLGDLIHKGIYSDELVTIVNKLIENNPGKWIQLFGNHEFQHIKGAPYFWSCNCSAQTISILNNWYDNKTARASYFIAPRENFSLPEPFFNIPKSLKFNSDLLSNKGILFSHAGLTFDFWESIVSPDSARTASKRINSLTVHEVSRPGVMLTGHKVGSRAGPVWALSTVEVFASWEKSKIEHIPFIQVHGHSPAYNWAYKSWHAGTPMVFRNQTRLDVENRIIYTYNKNSLQICLDPGFGKDFDLLSQPYLVVNH